MTKQKSRAGALGLAVVGVLAASWLLAPEASAMPQWARRYGVDCTVCHTTVPHLTQTGYKFRRAGFRMPDEIGAEAKLNGLGDLYSVRVREDFSVTAAATDGKAANGKVAPTNEFLFNELTFYPISGAWGKYWGAETELTFMPDELPEVENGYARATVPVNQDLFVTARAGIFHPFEGFGGSDRPISNFRPNFQNNAAATTVAGTKFDSRVLLWGQDQQGLELGATWKDTTVSLAIVNGYNAALDAADSAKRNTPGSPVTHDDDKNRDFIFFFNQFIGDKAAVSAEYLNGKSNWGYTGVPPGSLTDARFAKDTGVPAVPTWTNNYQRLAVYGSYDLLPKNKADLMGGWEIGQDHRPNALVATDNSDRFNSTGWYLEMNSKLHDHLTAAARYDTFRPSLRDAGNRISAVTLTAVMPFEYVKFMLDYQMKRTQKTGAAKDVTNNTIQAEWMVHY